MRTISEKHKELESNKKTAVLLIFVEVLLLYLIFSLMWETGNLGFYAMFILFFLDLLRRVINLFKKAPKKNAKSNAKTKRSKKPA